MDKKRSRYPKSVDIGQRFGRVTIVQRLGTTETGNALWLCACDCGLLTKLISRALTSKNPSCGCARHWMHKTPEYEAWCAMRDRCYNKKNAGYHLYGARGIEVDPRWINNFKLFYQDMGRRPSKNHSLDRENNNAGYFYGNCRWATPKEQGENRRTTKSCIAAGRAFKSLARASEALGMCTATIIKYAAQERAGYAVAPNRRNLVAIRATKGVWLVNRRK